MESLEILSLIFSSLPLNNGIDILYNQTTICYTKTMYF